MADDIIQRIVIEGVYQAQAAFRSVASSAQSSFHATGARGGSLEMAGMSVVAGGKNRPMFNRLLRPST
jgi:hypothetical protein